ncbi:SDR family NAD(P)-dependent oxidoreductase [Catenulispora subtropica]|uniref:Glucose 1-dehydrogenase n=1 Tax=Catenulispora subtropica TaxID=450798 RepID=A0ABN2T6P0_9ACTN
MDDEGLAGRVALVTGGGSGIGRAVAVALAAAGARVVVAGRTAERLVGTVELADKAAAVAGGGSQDGGRARAPVGGTGARAHVVDVTDPAAVAGLFAALERDHGRLDIAVNNAGRPSWGPVADTPRHEWDAVLGVNLTGVWLCLKHEIDLMRRGGGGAVVNIASRVGMPMREPYQGVYAASKAALSVLTRTAARECAGSGIRINAVSPGPTETGAGQGGRETPGGREASEERDLRDARDVRSAHTGPIGRLASPAEIAAAVRWLVSSHASYVIGHDLVVDGGLSA